MQGSHDLGIVALSYLIASLAGFVAIAFASRMLVRKSNRLPWLIGGASAMGTGIWSMHFVGMTAFSLPVQISYDLGITALSWLAAVAASALALFIVGYGHVRTSTVTLGALSMGAGICVMHYSGMWAMRMSPAISYDATMFIVSVVIAVAASAAAILILAHLKTVRSWRDVAMRVGAALVMGVAVCGMHYTGMAAAEFADGAFCAPGNQLQAKALPWPTTIGTLLILGFGILTTLGDARDIASARRAEREMEARVQTMAFTDRQMNLPNRAGISQTIAERARAGSPEGFAVVTFRVDTAAGEEATLETMKFIAERLARALPDAALARTRPEHLVLLLDGGKDAAMQRCAGIIEKLEHELALRSIDAVVSMNSAHCPSEGDNAQWLLLRSSPKSSSDESSAVA